MRARWTDEDVAAVEALLAAAKGRRTARTLDVAAVQACVEEALASRYGIAWRHGGEAGDARALTTVCLAVVDRDAVTVGIAAAHAQDVTPARAFDDLPRWERFDEAANVPACRAWAGRGRPDRVRLQAEAPEPRRELEARLLQAVLAAPLDEGPRQVLADWWLERGDPRGQFVTLQLAREALAPGEPQATALARQEAELLEAHGDAWLRGALPFVRARFRGGFVEEVTLIDAAGLDALDALMAFEPVTRLVCLTPRRIDVPRLAAASWVSRLRTLAFEAWQGGASALRTSGLAQLLASRELHSLESLRFDAQDLGDAGLRLLIKEGRAVVPRLRALEFCGDDVGEEALRELLSSRFGLSLERLSLANSLRRPSVARVFAQLGEGGALRELDLTGNRLGPGEGLALASSARLAALRRLVVRSNELGDVGVQALLESPALRGLTGLDVSLNGHGRAVEAQLARRFLQRRG
jgi:uncharacterized protein (TIGR02996 family)